MPATAVSCPIVDVDSHITEPPDLWTSRLPSKWVDIGPHTERHPESGEDRWRIGPHLLSGVASSAMAGWREALPSHPKRLADADPASWDPTARVRRLDEYGITAQVLYPNLLGFHTQSLLDMGQPDVMLACVQAYNDFVTDFVRVAPNRLLGMTSLPFWDVEASVAEIERCASAGHRGILFSHHFSKVGLPPLADRHWAPVLEAAQGLELPLNFHIGFNERSKKEYDAFVTHDKKADYARFSALAFLSNAQAIAELIMTGVCAAYPRLNFVSVESGFSWLPFLLESLDWQWLNSGVGEEEPDRLLPSEYFRRQIYGSFWFEREALQHMIDLYPDNIMFETDFPHPTSLSPGPASTARQPRAMMEEVFANVPAEQTEKAMYRTAARLYHLDL